MAHVGSLLVHRGSRAVEHLVEHAPASGGLALWVRHQDIEASASGETPARAPAHAHAPSITPGNAPNDAPGQAPVITDGRTLFYASRFAALPLPMQAGWIAHAVLHVALRHPQRGLALQRRTGDVDPVLFNVCADAIVNTALGHLGWLALPPDAVRLEVLLAEALGEQVTPEAALLRWDVESLYRAIDDRQAAGAADDARKHRGRGRGTTRDGDGDGDRGEGERGAGRDDGEDRDTRDARPAERIDGPRARQVRRLATPGGADLMPSADAADAPQDEAEAAREWRERLLRGHAGDGEFSLLRTLMADVPRERTPWEQALRVQLARGLAQRPGPSWSRPSRSWLANQGRSAAGRRMPWEPGVTASRVVPRLAVVVDVSGSIDDALLARFAGELEAIARRLGATVDLVIGDDRVREVVRLEPGRGRLQDVAFRGGGGTDFTPLLAQAQALRPDLIVVLTDLDGPAGPRPAVPVIWAVPDPAAGLVAPFGRLLPLH